MKKLILLAAFAAAACATTAPVREIETQEVVVTHTERALTEQQVRDTVPPSPLPPRPAGLSAALDEALAKLCEYVRYADRADTFLQHAAGMTPIQRVQEAVCQARPTAPPG